MGYRIKLTDVDRDRLANIFKLAEHIMNHTPLRGIPSHTGEDIALCQKLRKVMEDKKEYFVIMDSSNDNY